MRFGYSRLLSGAVAIKLVVTLKNANRKLLAKAKGRWWDPLIGRSGWSADWWAPTPTSSFVQSLLGNFVKAVWGASPAATRSR